MSTRYVEFQAVVMAGGKGSRMTELTKGKPKCLLPIQNKPMIWFPLNLLEKSRFTEVIVIVPQSSKAEIVSAVDKLGLKIKIDWVSVPDNVQTGEDPGTADSLRLIYHKIVADLLVVSCDLIMDIDITNFVKIHRLHESSIVAMFFPLLELPPELEVPGPKKSLETERDFVGIDSSASDRLVLFTSSSDLRDNFEIQKKVLLKHPNFVMHSKLLDAHFYIIKKSVVDYLNNKKNIITIKGELVPLVVKKQLTRRPKPEKSKHEKKEDAYKSSSDDPKEDKFDEIYQFIKEDPVDASILDKTTWSDHQYLGIEPYHGDIIRCYAYLNNNERAIRVNNLHYYKHANFMDLPLEKELIKISDTATMVGTQIQNSYLGDKSYIDEKTSIYNSRIGVNSKVKSRSTVKNSIIMENVTINERCIIENCIISNDCDIEEGVVLRDCIISSKQTIKKDSKHSREFLTDDKKMMEI